MFIKLYCSPEEKKKIEKDAKQSGAKSTSQYLKNRAFAGEHDQAALVELIGCMVKLLETQDSSDNVKEALFAVANDVLAGCPLTQAREKIVEVCSHADQSHSG